MENNKEIEFTQRLDFYWQYTTVYLIVLIIYAVFRGTIEEHIFTFEFFDPVVILLSIFIIYSLLNLAFSYYKKKSIIISDDYIIFTTRHKQRKYFKKDIQKISFTKKRSFRIKSGDIKIIKLVVKGRKYAIRIRPNSFNNDSELIHSINKLKAAK